MEIEELHKKFVAVVSKYGLKDPQKATEVSDYIAKHKEFTVKQFAIDFAMEEADAGLFLAFLKKGLEFHQKTKQ